MPSSLLQTDEDFRAALAEKAKRGTETLSLYRPMPAQRDFHASLASERLLRGGNRSGKSVAGAAEVASAVTGIPLRDLEGNPLPFMYPTDVPMTVWVIGYDEKHISRIYRKLFEPGQVPIIQDADTGKWRAWRPWNPEDKEREYETRPSPAFIPSRFSIDGQPWSKSKSMTWDGKGQQVFTVARLRNGNAIYAFTSGGVPGQGEPVHLIWIDEDIQIPGHFFEWEARLSDARGFPAPLTGGRLIWTVWPHTTNRALVNVHKRAEAQKDREKRDVEEWVLSFDENPFIDDEEKRKRVEGWEAVSSAVARSRNKGDFVFDTTLVFPTFNIDTHGIPSKTKPDKLERFLADREYQIPLDWTNYMVLDPGHTQPCVILAAVPPPVEFGDYVVVWGEVYIPRINGDQLAAEVRKLVMGRVLEEWIIDFRAGRQTQAGIGKTTAAIYTEAFKRAGLRTAAGTAGFVWGSDNIAARNLIVQQWLAPQPDTGYPKLRLLTDRTPAMQQEFGLYSKRVTKEDVKEEVIDQNNHAMDCFDAETEVLTGDGWKLFSEVHFADTIATVDLETDALEYQHPTGIIARPHSGPMYYFGGRKLNAAVTPNHRMVVYPQGKSRPEVKFAKTLKIWDKIKLTATWSGSDSTKYLLPKVYNAVHKPVEIDAGDYAELLGWYVAEGSCNRVPLMPGSGYRVTISQIPGGKRERLRNVLLSLPWSWYEDCNGFYCSSKQLWSIVRPLGKCYDKYVPDWIRWASRHVIGRFIDGAVAGDGTIQNGIRKYYTTSKVLADQMQELFIKVGRTASVSLKKQGPCILRGECYETQPLYVVTEWICPTGMLRDSRNVPNFVVQHYEGTVYCVEVPNGTLVVRRHGKPMIAGNCLGYLAAYNPTWIQRDPMEFPTHPAIQAWRRMEGKKRETETVWMGAGRPPELEYAGSAAADFEMV